MMTQKWNVVRKLILWPVFSIDGANSELPDISSQKSTNVSQKSHKIKLLMENLKFGNSEVTFFAVVWRTLNVAICIVILWESFNKQSIDGHS